MSLEKIIKKSIIEVFADEKEQNLEEWEYLIHHVEVDKDKEILHHCFMLDHLGNLYETEHIDDGGKIRHVLKGLASDQEVLWSNQDAEEAGYDVPCSDRQLPK